MREDVARLIEALAALAMAASLVVPLIVMVTSHG